MALTPEKPGAYHIMADAGVPPEVLGMAVRSVRFDVLHDRGNAVARAFVPNNYRKRAEVDAILDALHALQPQAA